VRAVQILHPNVSAIMANVTPASSIARTSSMCGASLRGGTGRSP
jgi:hypothetical protein